jgi:hypothetical protein
MTKEQLRLEDLLRGKDDVLTRQEEELEKLRKQNKKLQMLSKAKLMLMGDEDRDMDTPSSEDSSPKASFSKVPKVEIRPRTLAAKMAAAETKGNNIKTSAPVASLIAGETEQIRHDMRAMMLQPPDDVAPPTPPPKHRSDPPTVQPRPPRATPIGACSPTSPTSSENGQSKPPVPSRAAVNKKLQGKQGQPPPTPPPPLPLRSQMSKSPKEERVDSGRESDDFAASVDTSFDESKMKKNFKEFLRDNMSSYVSSTASGRTTASSSVISFNGDEGFSSSHEDHQNPCPPMPPPRTTSHVLEADCQRTQSSSSSSSARQLTNHHRAVQKPRDIKYRSKLKSNSTSSLGVLEEHQVVTSGGVGPGDDGAGGVTTVTYWTEPYL